MTITDHACITPGTDTLIRPYRLQVPQSDLDDLTKRLQRTRWPDDDYGEPWRLGPPLDYLRELADYWASEYDWRAQEARLNAHPQFLTEIDGHDVHFLHVRSPHDGALPLILTHGWPGSIVEFLEVIAPLTDPAAHGGDPADAFHLVIPTIPGFGIPGPTTGDWSTDRVAQVWTELMSRLGYRRYAAHGGDFGSVISRHLGIIDAEHVAALHLTALLSSGAQAGSDPADPEVAQSLAKGQRYQQELMGYASVQSTKPQSLAYGLTDSAVGQLAWIVERFKDWTDSSSEPEDAVDRDTILTNVMLYWLFRTAGSSARYYHAGLSGWGTAPERSSTPTAMALMPADIARPVRSVADLTDNIVAWHEFPCGGHFAALEQPALIVDDLRATLRPYR